MDKVKSLHSFEEAIALTGNGKLHFIILLVSGSSLMSVIIEGLNMAFVLPLAKCDLNISTGEQGLINAVGFIGILLTSHLWGFLSDTWGRQKVLRTALLLTFITCAASSLSYTSTMLLLTRFAVGLSLSGLQSTGISYLGEFHCKSNRAKYVTLAVMGMPIAIVYQSVVGLIFLPMEWEYPMIGLIYTPWRLYLFVSSIITAVGFVVMLFLPESPKFCLAMGKSDEALSIMKQVYSVNTGKAPETFPVKAVALEETGSNLSDVHGAKDVCKMMWNQTWPLFFPPYLGKILLLIYLMFAMFFVAHGFYLWLPQILSLYYENMEKSITICKAVELGLNYTIEMDIKQNSTECIIPKNNELTYYITGINGLCFVAIFWLVALTVNRFGKKNLITIWLVACSIGTLGLQWGNNFYLNVFLFMLLNATAPCASSICANAAEFFPTHFQGMALCLIMLFCRIGSITGSNVFGALMFNGHCELILGIDAALVVVCIGIYLFLYRKNG